jgi:hypothetical protein
MEVLRSGSERRLTALRSDLRRKITSADTRRLNPRLCIYATGSLARLEANEWSDLDAFFFLSGSSDKRPLSRIRDVKILNAVVETAYAHKFPDFSNDGEYLKFLHIDDVVKHIGGREDDYHNALTARMLLMLESQYLYNRQLYEKFRAQVIERYFVDFHRHTHDFKPIFLLNDVLRFWRTLCLNYENGREWRSPDKEKRAKGHLSNLKLRFSRLTICYSFIAKLLVCGRNITQQQVVEVARMTPLDRLRMLGNGDASRAAEVSTLLREYEWFLKAVSRPKQDVLDWISHAPSRDDAFAHGNEYVNAMFRLVDSIAREHKYSRFLVI